MMNIQWVNPDRKEAPVELPLRSFSKDKKLKKHIYKIDKPCFKASFSEIRTPHFCVVDTKILCHDAIKMCLQTKGDGNICFCAVLQGCVTSFYEPFGYEEKWQEGKANLLSFEGLNSTCFLINEPFWMREIVLSEKYLEELSCQYPELLRRIVGSNLRDKWFKVFKQNKIFCPKIVMALNDIFNSSIGVDSEEMYIDAKIREILSLFLCRNKRKACSGCSCLSPKDKNLLIQVKEIVDKEYKDPPSLRNLALMVGTNEFKLKNGFKLLFGTTVFGYLFECRMEKACFLLLDGEMSIQEIGNDIGYEHHSHFSTAFKRKFGVSPTEYRIQRNTEWETF